ncbi:MAG: hypothetical protein Tsb009_02600 [Planctomycetaceae bacterium]
MLGCSAEENEVQADKPTSKSDRKSTDKKPSKKKYPANRLAKETSPYLLLHAHNPVQWYPWGPEAFAKAKKERKPIFLSVGYSSCYWCHVMERLVFMDENIAKQMNANFVCIKVDREERPDLDDIYMTSLHVYFRAIGSPQGGGWPLSMFLTPDGKPFAGGTYFPPKDQDGRVGFPTVLKRVHQLWTNRRKDIESNAELLTTRVRQAMKPRPVLTPVKLNRQLVRDTVAALLDTYDSQHGGLGYRPGARNPSKFPVPAKLAFLQYVAEHSNDKQAAKAVSHTLDRIAAGGIHDHLGGGFHRYSTDRFWHVPHFEKMLYDQAQLADVYLTAYQATNKASYREAAEGIFRFVLREMTDNKGGFYSALDAETDGVEGEYYVWSPNEVEKILGKADAKLFKQVYGFEEPQVFEHGYVLHLPKSLAEVAKESKTSLTDLKKRLQAMRAKLFKARSKRKPLLRDDKVLVSWNGLMIRAFANGGRILKRKEYIQAAEKAADFILKEMRDDKQRLHRTWRAGQAKLNAYVDDYAFLVDGLLALHRATNEKKWLAVARELTDEQIKQYWSQIGGGFFFTPHHHEELIVRTRNAYDAVIPSGNSISVRNLLRLAKLTGEKKYREYAQKTLNVFANGIVNTPNGMAHMALAVGEYLEGEPKSKPKPAGKTSRFIPLNLDLNNPGTIHQVTFLETDEKSTDPKRKKKAIVTAKAFLSVDKLPSGRSCRIVLFLNIAKGWHINANPPQPKTSIPTTFSLVSRQGVKLTNVKYPKGKKIKLPEFDEASHVYDGVVAIYGTLQVPNLDTVQITNVELRIRYQACNDTVCRPPKTIRLKGALPVAPSTEAVRIINQKYFPKPKSGT